MSYDFGQPISAKKLTGWSHSPTINLSSRVQDRAKRTQSEFPQLINTTAVWINAFILLDDLEVTSSYFFPKESKYREYINPDKKAAAEKLTAISEDLLKIYFLKHDMQTFKRVLKNKIEDIQLGAKKRSITISEDTATKRAIDVAFKNAVYFIIDKMAKESTGDVEGKEARVLFCVHDEIKLMKKDDILNFFNHAKNDRAVTTRVGRHMIHVADSDKDFRAQFVAALNSVDLKDSNHYVANVIRFLFPRDLGKFGDSLIRYHQRYCALFMKADYMLKVNFLTNRNYNDVITEIAMRVILGDERADMCVHWARGQDDDFKEAQENYFKKYSIKTGKSAKKAVKSSDSQVNSQAIQQTKKG